ncbi:NAD(P)/FAD-dependent oxidoreductase [Nakamurella endophytica]|uniref:Oxidoreductase n=1 Tax=Nakamurella endophytica TaxID=1748367 RepID=A0A917T0I8_9ACTN|nr:FAD-dependent oxidoreductase [Nakamurella endophytica]GGM05020.1 oxidoreductase [Nakamurella endophytica]
MTAPVLTPDVLVVGAGPAGLTAATALAARVGQVLVLDREATAGGIPRHSDHPGYGIRDLHRFLSGPEYARRLVDRAGAAGVEVRTAATVTDWSGDRSVEVTSPQGRFRVDAGAVVLATGARERPRPARLVPGDRPAGVYTTGALQNLVHLHGGRLGGRAVVVGAELVSWSAVLTLRHAGARTVLMTTTQRHPESYAAFIVPGRAVLRVPVATRTRLTRIVGRGRLTAVEVEDLDTGRRRTVECDTLVLTGDWIPDHELARSAGLEIDRGSRGPVVDTELRTGRPGVFAVGNLVHPVDTADCAALDGRHVADPVRRWLDSPDHWDDAGVAVQVDEPLLWAAPGRFRPGGPTPARGRLLFWCRDEIRSPRLTVRQDGRTLADRRMPWPASPGRIFRAPWSVLSGARADAGPVTVSVR